MAITHHYFEKLNADNIKFLLLSGLNCIFLIKSSTIKSEENVAKVFYTGILKASLNYFAKNSNFYLDDIYNSKTNIKKVMEKIDLGLLLCKQLKNENYLESGDNSIHEDLLNNNDVSFELENQSRRSFFNYKNFVTIKSKKDFWSIQSLRSSYIGNWNHNYWNLNLSTFNNLDSERKNNFSSIVVNINANLKKLLLICIENDIDNLKGFYRNEFQFQKTEFTLEDKSFNENELKPMIFSAMEINLNLLVFMYKKMAYIFGENYVITNVIKDMAHKYSLFYLKSPLVLDFYIEKNFEKHEFMKPIFYWTTPQIPILFKYVTLEYDKYRAVHVYFCQSMKRLESEQLLFYLPQIFQTLNTNASYLIKKFLLEYAKSSFLFCHQLIWKSKVEAKKEKEIPNVPASKLPFLANKILLGVYKNMNKTEKQIFENVDDFFEKITGISGILKPKQPKAEKKEIIKTKLGQIPVNEFLYIPCSPYYKIINIKLDSGTPMQSAAKCPILVSFYCNKFEVILFIYPQTFLL